MNYYIVIGLIYLIIIIVGFLINKIIFKKGIKNFDKKVICAVIIICAVIWYLPQEKMLGFKTATKNFEYFHPYTFGKIFQEFKYEKETYIFAYSDESINVKFYKKYNNKWYFKENFNSKLIHLGSYPVVVYSLPNTDFYALNITCTDEKKHNIKDILSSKVYTNVNYDPISGDAVSSYNMIFIKQKNIKNYVLEIDEVKFKPFK